jgi:hypothetical protein
VSEGSALRTRQGTLSPGPLAKGEALCNLSIGWLRERGQRWCIEVSVGPSLAANQNEWFQGQCPWQGPGAVPLVGVRGETPAHSP